MSLSRRLAFAALCGLGSKARLGLLSLLLCGLLPQMVEAQEAEWRTVNGRVVRPAPFLEGDTTAVVGMPNLKVVLHRVSSTLQGPLDSTRTDGEGRYRFRFQPSGGADAVYFVSAMHDDIAYFTNPLRGLVNEGSDAEIAVFDTTSVPFPLTVRGRHLIVGALDSLGERTVVEIFEVSNDSTRTLVAPDSPDADPTWSFPIPRAARDVKAGQGDVSADAFVQSPGRVALYAALAPGLKQLSVTYKVPDNGFPLDLVIDGGAVVLEVLLEEPDATVRGGNLVAVEPVGLEGRQFVRYLAQDVRPGAAITIETPSGKLGGRGLYVTALLGAIGLLMLLALFRAGTRRQGRRETVAPRLGAVPNEVPTPERLAREIADLDAAFAAQTEPSEAVRAAYTRRRAELADLLREELAARTAGV